MSSLRASIALLAIIVGGVVGCGGSGVKPLALPPPVEVTSVGAGDVFEMRIVGEDRLPTAYTVAPDGTVDLPYIKRVKVEGLEPQEIAALVRKLLVEKEIRTDPDVTVNVKDYTSKRVEIIGEVQRPGSLPMTPGMTLLRAISIAGGFNALANKSRVTIRRKVKGATLAATVSVDDIIDNKIPDPPLQAGDSINVGQRVF